LNAVIDAFPDIIDEVSFGISSDTATSFGISIETPDAGIPNTGISIESCALAKSADETAAKIPNAKWPLIFICRSIALFGKGVRPRRNLNMDTHQSVINTIKDLFREVALGLAVEPAHQSKSDNSINIRSRSSTESASFTIVRIARSG